MSDTLRYLEGHLKPGYKFIRVEGNTYEVHKDNEVVRDPQTHRPLTVLDIGGFDRRRAMLKSLRDAGAAYKGEKREKRLDPEPKTIESETPNPILMAQEIMRDVQSTPRERRISKEYLALFERHSRVKLLAQKLGARVRELEEELDKT